MEAGDLEEVVADLEEEVVDLEEVVVVEVVEEAEVAEVEVEAVAIRRHHRPSIRV
jgi:hypothetical protein